MDSVIPPESLINLIMNLEFLGGISNNQKYCFVTKQYVPNIWYYSIWRSFLGESQETNGIATMERICRDASEQWNVYRNNNNFRELLLDAIVKSRHGLQRCHDNYLSLQKTQTATSIRLKSIGPLDNLIPEERKITEGIISKTQNKSVRSNSVTSNNSTEKAKINVSNLEDVDDE